MEETCRNNPALDHVNTISESVAVLQLLEELMVVAGAYSPQASIGMEVVIRGVKEKLSNSRDALQSIHGTNGTTEARATMASGVQA